MKMAVNRAQQIQRGTDDTEGQPLGESNHYRMGKYMSAEHYAKHDPFYCIRSNGRRGAGVRMMRGEHRRKARIVPASEGRIFLSDKRHAAYQESLKALEPIMRNPQARRAQAIRNARRAEA